MFVSSHVLAELEQVCDWLIVIDHGALVFQDPASELLEGSPSTMSPFSSITTTCHGSSTCSTPPARQRGHRQRAGRRGQRHRAPRARRGDQPHCGRRRDRARRARAAQDHPRRPLPHHGERRRPMTRMFRAELLKLRRPRILIVSALGALTFAAITTIAVLLSADERRRPPLRRAGRRDARVARRAGRRDGGVLHANVLRRDPRARPLHRELRGRVLPGDGPHAAGCASPAAWGCSPASWQPCWCSPPEFWRSPSS